MAEKAVPRSQADFVIRDGALIGDFEGLYRAFDEPWDQRRREADALEKLIALELLRRNGHRAASEYGCGLGYFTRRLREVCGRAAGIDIAPSAIDRARRLNPGPDYYVGGILDRSVLDAFAPDALCLAEVSWYALEALDSFKSLIAERARGAGFVHLLMTYAPGEQRYGADRFTDLPGIVDYWSDVVEFSDWGQVSGPHYAGGARTYCYGRIR